MPGLVTLHFDDSDALKLLESITDIREEVVPLAANRALNRAASKVRVQAIRAVSKASAIAPRKVGERIKVEPSSSFSLEVTVKAQGRAYNLIEFVSPGKRRVGAFRLTRRGKLRRGGGVKANAWGVRKEYRGTFIVPGKKSGKLIVVARDEKGRPSKTIYGPRVPREFLQDTVTRIMQSTAHSEFLRVFERELDVRMKRII